MKICITGASGYIGNRLAHALAVSGQQVHALIRREADNAFLQHDNIKTFQGDLLKKETLLPALQGCKRIFHTAARVGVWAKDPSVFYAVNVKGTENLLAAALDSNVERIVFTSTCGVLGPSLDKPLTENHLRTTTFDIHYDHSKKMAEDMLPAFIEKGLEIVTVSPSKVYGPGYTSHSLTANAIIDRFLKSGITFIPHPGTFKVCLAFLEDIVNGHLLAMENGTSGEKYILGGVNISYLDFFGRIRTLAGGRGRIMKVGRAVMKVLAQLQNVNHKITGMPVRFTVPSINYLFHDFTFSSDKAIIDLGYRITPLDEALQTTIQFLNNRSHEKSLSHLDNRRK